MKTRTQLLTITLLTTLITLMGTACSKSKHQDQSAVQGGSNDDINPPLEVTNPMLIINDDMEFTSNTSVQIKATAGGATQVYLTNDASCASGGEWKDVNEVHDYTLPQSNQLVRVYGKFRSKDEIESACVSDEILHDNTAPALNFTGGTTAGTISSQTTFSFEYNVQENGSGLNQFKCRVNDVEVACTAGTKLDVTVASSGTHELKISLTDKAGNSSTANLQWTVVPAIGLISFSINNGAAYTRSAQVDLSFMAENATLMKLAHDDQCSDGTFESFAAAKTFTLENLNSENAIYAQYSNAAADKSPCLKAIITHDDTKPILNMTNAPSENAVVTQLSPVSLTISDAGSGLKTHQCQINTTVLECPTSGSFELGDLEEGSHHLNVSAEDNAGNIESVSRNFVFLKPLGAASLVIDGGAVYSNHTSGYVTLTLNAENAKEMYITNHANCESGGVWEAYSKIKTDWNLGLLNQGETSVFVKFRNTESLSSPCVSSSIIHDSLPYSLTFIDPLPVYVEGKKNLLKYKVLDGSKELTGFDEIATFQGCELESQGTWQKYDCPNFGVINISNLKIGSYKVRLAAQDQAGNGALVIASFEIKENYLSCDDPIFENAPHIGACLTFVDSFERGTPADKDQKNWMLIVDDLARTQSDKINVQATIIREKQYKFGPAIDAERALYFTGRRGKAFNKVFLISKIMDLKKFDTAQVDFNYLPIRLEKYTAAGKFLPENIKLEVCTSTPLKCGAYVLPTTATTSQKQAHAKALNSAHWTSFYEQPGLSSGQLSPIEAGIKNDGRTHTRSTWLLGTGLLDLNSKLIIDKTQVVFRVSVSIDEGFRSIYASGQPNFNSTIEDAIGIDLVKVLTMQHE